jgi:site-specific recombinase XerD
LRQTHSRVVESAVLRRSELVCVAEEELSVTSLRQIMLEELRRRNYAESTIRAYISTVEHFSRHSHRLPDQLGPERILQYQAALFTRWKLAPNTVTQRLAALRFFHVQVLKKGWSVAGLYRCSDRPSNDQTFSITANRKAVVNPNSSHPFSASIAPMRCQWSGSVSSVWP